MLDSLHNDRQLLSRVAKGDEGAFRNLVVFYRPQLLPFITTYTKSKSRAEEVVQDVFLQIWTVRQSLTDIKNFRGFLFVIAKNLALNVVREHLREKLRMQKWAEMNPEREVELPHEIKDEPDIVAAAVAQLPPQQKRVWIATRQEGKKLGEVANEMGLSVTTVKKYVRYATDNITAYLVKRGELLLLIFLFWKNNSTR